MLLISTAASVWAVTGLLNWNINPSADGYHPEHLAPTTRAHSRELRRSLRLRHALQRSPARKLHRSRHRHGHQHSPTHRPGRRARTDVGHRTGGVLAGLLAALGAKVDEVFEGDAFRSGRCRIGRRPALPRTVSAVTGSSQRRDPGNRDAVPGYHRHRRRVSCRMVTVTNWLMS